MDTILQQAMEAGEGPKYKRLVAAVTQAIETGALKPDDKLPPVRELAWKLGITPGTVARAFTILSEEGRVISEVGRGTFVQRPDAVRRVVPDVFPEVKPLYMPGPDEGDVLFAPRLPDVGQVQIIREAMVAAAEIDAKNLLNYPVFGTARELRETLLAWMPHEALGELSPDDLVLTNGGQNAIMVSLQATLTGEDPAILVEQQSYPGLRRAAEILRARVVPVPTDGEGVIPEALEEIALAEGARVFFTMPEVHNPTCMITPTVRRVQVAEVARRTGLQLLQDDCYRLGPPAGPSYRRLVPDHGWFISSLSKSISPSLRLGYVAAPRNQTKRLRRVVDANYYGVSGPMIGIVTQLLKHPEINRAVTDLRDTMRAYINIAVNALGRFDLGWAPDVPYFWLRLPAGWRESSFVQALEAEGIRVRPGSDFGSRDARAVHAVRISVNGQISQDRFSLVLNRIAELLDNPPERAGV